ncbi:hypothetical protein PR202_gb14924 [Eleusine coracana subsp. coracana]|uniref:Uncharacterized protein n=1 Tax=Eleusine coracana subsp. coracana TaxID=191504 RepID=A0AAV5EXN4_ELECO|nr:hypothetical protein PR202_gb14924 [Eleusine coracana subsp. coracana]
MAAAAHASSLSFLTGGGAAAVVHGTEHADDEEEERHHHRAGELPLLPPELPPSLLRAARAPRCFVTSAPACFFLQSCRSMSHLSLLL